MKSYQPLKAVMTIDERELLQGFLHDLIQVRVTNKDPVAEALIVQACTRAGLHNQGFCHRILVGDSDLNQVVKKPLQQFSFVDCHNGFQRLVRLQC